MKGVEWLKNYIREKSIDAEIIEVRKASTVNEAAEELGCSKRQIIKSIVLVAEDEAVIAIVDGTSSVDLKRVEELVGKKVRVAGRGSFEFNRILRRRCSAYRTRLQGNP